MSPSFHHGIELLRFYAGPKNIRTVATAVIGLVGTAPIHLLADPANRTINEPVLITSEEAAAKHFGPDTEGFTIPAALRAIFAQGAGTVFVVNVFDPERHTDGQGAPDPGRVAAADIIAGVDTNTGKRTGMGALRNCKSAYGFGPKQLICPVYTGWEGVLPDLVILADKLRAFAWADVPSRPEFASPTQAVQGRGTGRPLNIGSKNLAFCFPHVKTINGRGEIELQGMSAFLAGAQANKDLTTGFHHSVSNTELKGVTGMAYPVEADLMDPTCEADLLNGAGIVTIYNSFGTGYRTWGNRNASFPASSDPDNFISVQRTANIIEDSINAFSLDYMDKPITSGLISQILLDINAYLNGLVGIGASRDGAKAWFDAGKNPPQALADGKLRICYKFLPPAPLETLVYESYIDVSLAATA